jgi:hypothetical protein
MVASVSTKATAADIPSEVSIFFDTPRNGHIPKNCDNTMLFTNMALMKIKMYSITIFFWGVQGDMETGRQDICLELLELLVYLSPSLF